ncbi:MAG: thioesterase family protein [Leeuwenhoekiella sp.]
MQSQLFEINLTIPADAIDQMGHVNNVKYLQWMQDVAQAHWLHETTEDIQKQYAWVALEHHIKYHNPSFVNEPIILKTWVESFEGVKSIRNTEIVRAVDQKVLVSAVTHWCLLRMPEGRPTRIPKIISDLY